MPCTHYVRGTSTTTSVTSSAECSSTQRRQQRQPRRPRSSPALRAPGSMSPTDVPAALALGDRGRQPAQRRLPSPATARSSAPPSMGRPSARPPRSSAAARRTLDLTVSDGQLVRGRSRHRDLREWPPGAGEGAGRALPPSSTTSTRRSRRRAQGGARTAGSSSSPWASRLELMSPVSLDVPLRRDPALLRRRTRSPSSPWSTRSSARRRRCPTGSRPRLPCGLEPTTSTPTATANTMPALPRLLLEALRRHQVRSDQCPEKQVCLDPEGVCGVPIPPTCKYRIPGSPRSTRAPIRLKSRRKIARAHGSHEAATNLPSVPCAPLRPLRLIPGLFRAF